LAQMFAYNPGLLAIHPHAAGGRSLSTGAGLRTLAPRANVNTVALCGVTPSFGLNAAGGLHS
jgi:hypothetical protein